MAINVGDAVLTFIGDTTNLDQAFDRVNNTSKSKLQPVSATIQDIGGQWQFTGQAASTAGSLADVAGAQMEESGHRGSRSFHETREAVDLLAHEFGIELPRELKGFLAGLGPVQGLLAGAFEVVAIGALIAALVEGTEKLSEWVAETFIFTEAMRAVDEVSTETNKKIAEQVDQLGKLKEAYALIGLQGSALTIGQFSKLSETADQASAKLRDFQNEIFGVRSGLVSLPEATDVANQHIRELFKDLPEADLKKKLLPDDADLDQIIGVLADFAGKAKAEIDTTNQDLAGIQKSYDAQVLAEQIATQEARIVAMKQDGDAQVNLVLQLALARNAQLKNAYGADEAAQIDYNNRKYQSDLSAFIAQRALADQRLENDRKNLEIQKSLIAADDPQAAGKQAAIDQEIEAVERQHAASIISIDGEILAAKLQHDALAVQGNREANVALEAENKRFADTQRAQILALISSVAVAPEIDDSFNPLKHTLEDLANAYQVLGVQGVGALTVQLGEQEVALGKLSKAVDAGAASEHDYQLGLLTVLETELALARAQDDRSEASKKRISAIEAEVAAQQKNAGIQTQVNRLDQEWADFWGKTGGKRVTDQIRTMGDVGKKAFLDLVDGLGSAVAAAVTGSNSIGGALHNLLNAVLAEIAAECAVKAIKEVAEGLAALANPFTAYQAPAHFAAAAEFGAAAAAAGVAGAAVGTSSSSNQPSESTPSNLPPTQQTAATTAQQNPVQVLNIQRFAVGGLVTSPQLALIGDSRSGGGAREAVLPLDDKDAIAQIREAIGGGGEVHNHYHIRGDVIDHNQLMKKVSRESRRGKGRLYATTARRVAGS